MALFGPKRGRHPGKKARRHLRTNRRDRRSIRRSVQLRRAAALNRAQNAHEGGQLRAQIPVGSMVPGFVPGNPNPSRKILARQAIGMMPIVPFSPLNTEPLDITIEAQDVNE